MTHTTKSSPTPELLALKRAAADLTLLQTLTRPGKVGTDGTSLSRQMAAVIPLVIEGPQAVEPNTPAEDLANLGANWHRHTPTLQAALPFFREAMEGALDICHTILLPADWKAAKTLSGHSHHAGGLWRRGEASLSVQILARNTLPFHLLSDLSWKRRPRTSIVMVVEGLGEEARSGYEGFLEGLAQHCELTGALGENDANTPAGLSGDSQREHHATNGFRLIEDADFNKDDPWFAACPKVYYGYSDRTDDPLERVEAEPTPKPWWKRGQDGVPVNLGKALGSLRGSVQLIRIGGDFLSRRAHLPTRLVVSGYQRHTVHEPLTLSELAPEEILIHVRDPHSQRLAMSYKVEPSEDIPRQVLRRLRASCDDYAGAFARAAVLDSHLMPLQAGLPAPESKIESPALPAAKPPRKRPRD
jgi:hypothetical protein